jgi:hypothetical protein
VRGFGLDVHRDFREVGARVLRRSSAVQKTAGDRALQGQQVWEVKVVAGQ